MKFSLILGFLLFSQVSWAIQVEGLEVPDTVRVGGKTLPLTHTAVRRAMGFKIYLAAFYQAEKPTSANQFITNEAPSLLRMHYAYMSIPQGPLTSGTKDYFQKALGKNYGGEEAAFTQYIGCYNRPLVKGDIIEVSYEQSRGVAFVLSGKTNAVIPGVSFKQKLHSAWFGDNTPDLSFRKDLLGF